MFSKIIIFIIILLIVISVNNIFFSAENFEKITNNNNKKIELNNRFSFKNKLLSDVKNNVKNNMKNNEKQQIAEIDESILFNNKDYNQNLSIDNADNKYFYNSTINQSDINENAFNIVYSIDPIDYSNVETGISKCNKECGGICFENGYDGIATCYPLQPQTFDWGTLYKNPTFTYGYNAYGPENLPQ